MLKLEFQLLVRFLLICFASLSSATYVCRKPYIELTVSPHKKHVTVYWELEPENFHAGDWIGIYYGESDTNDSKKNKKLGIEATNPKGWIETDIEFKETIPEDFENCVILKYRAIYWRKNSALNHGDEAVVTTSIRTFPNWMTHYWSVLSKQKMQDIIIPGTRKSVSDPNVHEHRTQDQGVLQQLLMGIRAFDIRTSYNASQFQYWVSSKNGRNIMKLDDVIHDVIKFVSKTDKEIVIFDIQEPNDGSLSGHSHYQVTEGLKRKFERDGRKWWIPRNSWSATLEQIYNNENRGKIIIRYKYNVSRDNFAWPARQRVCGPVPSNLCSVNSGDHVTESINRGEKIAEQIHNTLMKPEVMLNTNLISTDYFMGMGTVRKALYWNQRKFQPGADKNCDGKDQYADDYFMHNIIE